MEAAGRVILLDDQERLLRSLGRLLEGEGYAVRTATRFDEVDGELRPGRFDVLISDILMPGASGIDVLRVLTARGCQEPVVLITGEPNVETASEAVRLGAFDYLSKPVTKARLLEVTARAMRHVALLRERDEARENKIRVLESLARIGENAAMLVHEVKAPVSALNHALRVVADKIGADEQDVIREHVARLERLQDLMKKTLAYARPIERGTGSFAIQPLVTGVVRTFEATPGNKDVRVDLRATDRPIVVEGDSQWVEELLVNLLLNARKAAGPRCRLMVRAVSRTGPDGVEVLVLEVGDDGPGVPPSERDEVLKPFASGDTTGSGTGLGLAICVKIAHLFGGSLTVGEDPELGGALFRVELRTRSSETSSSS